MFECRKKYRVAIIVNIVIGDMSVTVAGTHVGRGRNTAAVRSQENLIHEKRVNCYFHQRSSRWRYQEELLTLQGPRISVLPNGEVRQLMYHYAGSLASYQNKDNMEGSGINIDGHLLFLKASSFQKMKLLEKLVGKARILDS